MRPTSHFFAALALLLGTPVLAAEPTAATAIAPAGATRIELRFTGIEKPTGAIMASVFDSEAAYAGGKPVRAVRIPVTGADAAETLEGLAPGTYAVKAFHDVDGDNRMAQNPFGMPLEPFAFSNDAPAHMGPPAWGAAKFEAAEGATVHTITIK